MAIKNVLKRTGIIAAISIPALIAFVFVSIEISSQPRFCGTCHYMTPYYESWKTSTHKEAKCTECHIPPGIASEFQKKYEALAMVARYVTRTYSTNPWAEVDDRSCLRSGCHTKRVLLSKELYKGILFDHQPHLTEMRRGKRLRCTSCHSQIVQGQHIAVTAGTCFLCHFKDAELNEGTGQCTLCHEVPDKMITTAGLAFNHGDVKRFDMDCKSCHQGVVKGDGEVLPERCYTCHNDPERLDLFENTELLHETHVTDHKVECLHCHQEISHRVPAREEALATGCETCHAAPAGHSPVRDLYRGISAKGVQPRPAAMYLAGIRCEACHNIPRLDPGRANAVSCMSCHGPKYLTIYRTWQLGLDRRLEGVKTELVQVQRQFSDTSEAKDLERLYNVAANVSLVERAHGIHNPGYALDILESSHRTLRELMETQGGETVPSVPWLQAPYDAECLQCHFGIEYITRPAFERDFPHGTHVVQAGLRCTICHEDVDRHGVLKLEAGDCDSCHGRITKPMEGLAPGDCLECHTAEIGPVSDAVRFPHAIHAEMGFGCETCHAGVEETAHVAFSRSDTALPKLEHASCSTCHAADVPSEEGDMPEEADCSKCHMDF